MEMMGQEADFVTNLSKELDPPLVTLLSNEALRNINLIGHPQERDEGVLRQVQRPNLHQARETGYHD